MIIIIRIAGEINISKDIAELLHRMRLRRKYSAVLIHPTAETKFILKKLRDFVAYGEISQEMLKELIEKRAQPLGKKKIDIASTIEKLETKKLDSLDIKPFFRLHPPRKGIDSKLHFPIKKGVLGDNGEKINDLLRRML